VIAEGETCGGLPYVVRSRVRVRRYLVVDRGEWEEIQE